MTDRLCAICRTALTGPQCQRPHHQSTEDVMLAAAQGCYVCGVITKSEAWKSLCDAGDDFHAIWYLSNPINVPSDWLKLTIDALPEDDDEEEDEEDDAGQGQTSAAVPGSSDFALGEPPIWGFLLQPVEAVKDNVGHHVPPMGGLESPGFLDLPLQWFNKCVVDHPKCAAKKPGFYPTRVLEILNQDRARLVISEGHIFEGPYASLSHCWGKAAKTLKLLDSNIDQLRAGIDIATLPTSYREAITVCRRFGFRYIWIDSLCIIQDSRDDWKREAFTMKDVYENSVLNIAAAAAAESSEASFTTRDPDFIRPVQVAGDWEDTTTKQLYYLVDENLYNTDVRDSPLHQRAWVLQETFLARRNLSLSRNQLWFDCSFSDACETYPQGAPKTLLNDPLARGLPLSDLEARYDRWSGVVEKYAACFLTFPSDKLIALTGIAQHFQELLPHDKYLAGLWRSQLPLALSWSTRKNRPCYRPDGYRAPSWSWASIEGPVRLEHNPEMADEGTISTPCVVLDVEVYAVGQQETGFLRGGYIKLKAPLTEVGVRDDSLTIESPTGKWELIKGSDEEIGDPGRRESWSAVDFDETTPDGTPAQSYLDPLTEQGCLDGQMKGIVRVRDSFEARVKHALLENRLFAMPLITFLIDGKRIVEGSVLLTRKGWPSNIYQRVGAFTVAGDIAVDALEKRSSEQIITIV